ncbi:hypothetical protein [Agromyces humi]|uniref:hypothetical protein n=1 Tax=Agromyces humi TaxID=1766800 RepID=UPI0013574EBC|nr:hypothetical protein [Agromyces humi]
MKLITSRVGSFLTGNEIADAVMRYGLALARKQQLDLIEIPFVSTDGSVRRAQFLIGWQLETAAISRVEQSDELVEADTAQLLNAKADRVGVITARPFSAEELADLATVPVDFVESC